MSPLVEDYYLRYGSNTCRTAIRTRVPDKLPICATTRDIARPPRHRATVRATVYVAEDVATLAMHAILGVHIARAWHGHGMDMAIGQDTRAGHPRVCAECT